MLSTFSRRCCYLAAVSSCFAAGWFAMPFFADDPEAKAALAPLEPEASPITSDEQLSHQWEHKIKPMLELYCFDCHGDGSHKGGLCLDDFNDLAAIRADAKTWDHILSRVDYQLMPPADEEQPQAKEKEALIAWINQTVFPVYPDPLDPGPLTTRRLNRIEYQNTLRDLLHIKPNILDTLPPDDSAHGFDNVSAALTISPAHIERYLQASNAALDKALVIGPMPPPVITLNLKKAKTKAQLRGEGVFLVSKSTVIIEHQAKRAGTYSLEVTASASRAGEGFAKLAIGHSDASVTTFDIINPLHTPKTYNATLNLKKGFNKLTLTFPNDYYDPKHPDPNRRDRNLMIHKVVLRGPTNVEHAKPASHRHIFPPRTAHTSDQDYAKEVLTRFGRKAFRRPVTESELTRYIGLAESIAKSNNNSIEQGIRGALQAMLVSPSFLFLNLPEHSNMESKDIQLISEHTLASRLSYFLWSSTPDDTLLDLADKGQLRNQLDEQISRMLADPRADQLPLNFAGQWLQLRDMDSTFPDRKTFPDFSRQLRKSMRQETEMLVSDILLKNRNLMELLTADYTYLNEELAQHYKISGVEGKHFRKVSLTDSKRRGILTHASILTLTSQPTRTSPVLRGKFVLENILHITPPPPPPNLPPLEDTKAHGKHLNVRQQLELHREKPSCASCHNLMDPIGFALDNYNAIGIWKDSTDEHPIDTRGQLFTGEKLDGPDSLLDILATTKQEEFLHSVTSKMLTYALGRGITRSDRHHVENITQQVSKNDNRAHALIRAIIHSPAFQYQRNN